MSSFIVQPKVIHRIVSFLDDSMYRNDMDSSISSLLEEYFHIQRYADNTEFFNKLAIKLLHLNEKAVNARYGDEDVLKMPGMVFKTITAREQAYKYQHIQSSKIQVYKSVQCLTYQCCEGDVPHDPLYKFLEELENQLAHCIVYELSEYQKAEWD